MKNKNKKYSILLIIFILFFCISIFPKTTNAADKYFYTIENSDGTTEEMGNINSGFNTKLECEDHVKKVHPSYKPSSCYSGGNITIKSFTPETGQYKVDTIEINGGNFIGVKNISIGNINCIYKILNTEKIVINIPINAITGKIVIDTNFRGTATSSKNFTVIKTESGWYYKNSNTDGELFGKEGRNSIIGFTSNSLCEIERQKIIKSLNLIGLNPCQQLTTEEAKKYIEDRAKNQAELNLNAVGDNPVVVNVTAQKNITIDSDNKYTPLAEIPGIKCMDPSGKDSSCISANIGEYLNIIFKIIIGICAALAVIMLIINGVTYMGDESVFGKTESKKKMLSAILGLFIALGAWALLNTINPALTGKYGTTIDTASAEIQPEEEIAPWSEYSTGDNIKLCKDGFGDVIAKNGMASSQNNPGTINVCNTIKDKLVYMINAAARDKISISGWGSRSTARQKQLRIEHGCPNETAPATSCTPPTAQPGHSMHEAGLAIDFTCNGQSMTSSGGKNSVCYKWLSKNAGAYGFKNLSSESWHWSTTGK